MSPRQANRLDWLNACCSTKLVIRRLASLTAKHVEMTLRISEEVRGGVKFDDVAVRQDQDPIIFQDQSASVMVSNLGWELTINDAAQAMRNCEDDAILESSDGFLDACVRLKIRRARRFVENNYFALLQQGAGEGQELRDRKSTRLNSSHSGESRMPSSA